MLIVISLFKIESAANVDAGEHFIKSTYNLKGDGPMVVNVSHMLAEQQ